MYVRKLHPTTKTLFLDNFSKSQKKEIVISMNIRKYVAWTNSRIVDVNLEYIPLVPRAVFNIKGFNDLVVI